MPHDLQGTWTSRTFDRNSGQLQQDPLGDFDLTRIDASGNVRNCVHNQKPITGGAVAATNSAPFSHVILINQALPPQRYIGMAIKDAFSDKVTTIIGVARDPTIVLSDKRALAAGQDEATWVATKNP